MYKAKEEGKEGAPDYTSCGLCEEYLVVER